MAIKDIKLKKKSPIEIDLTGPDGNAFALLGYARHYAKQLGLNGKDIQNQMMEGDYEHLVSTFDKYFGDYITLYR
jgi:hypothetical protein